MEQLDIDGPGVAAPPRRRVLLLIKCMGYGGAERLLLYMVRQRDRARFDYEVAYILDERDTLVPDLEKADVLVHSLGARGDFDLRWTARLRTLLERGDFDIVHAHLPYAATLGRLVARTLPPGRRPAFVYTEHCHWDKMAVAVKALNRATVGLDDRVLVVSEAAHRSMPAVVRNRSQVVVHGIELDAIRDAVARQREVRPAVRRELGLRDGELLALTVAGLRWQKGYDVLLQAASDAVGRETPVRFVAVGGGPQKSELAQLHASLRLGDRFLFLGERADVPELLAAADLFVLPSRFEGLPLALMEALSAGLPVVATAVGEIPALLHHGVDALLVPPESPQALAAAVETLAADPVRRERLGTAGSELATRFDVARCTREVEAVYDELCPQHRLQPT
ncbi:MAG TPA: glycosyltransferase [Acidimicrobiales bacterium]|nr:glycosyltransferase [Acidimicrobiales bacterium]